MSQPTVLVIEDDKHISKLLKYNLEKSGFRCLSSITAEEAFMVLEQNPVDLIVLDVMLPKMDGFETCKALKQDSKLSRIPIVMLTARGEEVDRIVGLELGADDYMVKPFSPRELVLRVKAILRRGGPTTAADDKEILTIGLLKVDIPKHTVTVSKKTVELSPMEFKLLLTLLKRRDRVQSRESLLEDVWGVSTEVTTRTIDTHIKLLRQKLGKAGKLIRTVRGIGYKLSEEG